MGQLQFIWWLLIYSIIDTILREKYIQFWKLRAITSYLEPAWWHAGLEDTLEDFLKFCRHDNEALDTFLQLQKLVTDQVHQSVVALDLLNQKREMVRWNQPVN